MDYETRKNLDFEWTYSFFGPPGTCPRTSSMEKEENETMPSQRRGPFSSSLWFMFGESLEGKKIKQNGF